ncbi:MAG: 3-oxoadipate enol-lactonase [Gammaproteobacteria bacterium]|jgi:pimeloyl-ACP methyl ester carboxylesterase|nr:3-oxoadipate enol-lactonase [Gammaproteobacteria bacterium]
MPFVKFDNDVNMYYEIHGKGEPMVMINGLKADHTGWAPTLDNLKENYQIILFDNRGTGQTTDDGKKFSIEDMADDVKKLMTYLGINSAHIVGHSLGGAIAQTFAHTYPESVKKLFLCNTFIKFNDEAAEAFGHVLKLHQQGARQSEIMDAIIPWVFIEGFVTESLRQIIHETSNANPYAQTCDGYQRQYEALVEFDSNKWIDQLCVSTIVIGSEKDITALPEESTELAHRTRAILEMLPGAHASAVEQAEALSRLVNYHASSCQHACRA